MLHFRKSCLHGFTLLILWSCSGSKNTPDPEEKLSVTFISPSVSSVLFYNQPTDLEVPATGEVKSVAFYLDGKSIGNASARPYKISWTAKDLDPGPHQIQATATSVKGNEFKTEVRILLKLKLGDTFRGGTVFDLDSAENHGLIAAEKDLTDETGKPQHFSWGNDEMMGSSFENGFENTGKLAAVATHANQIGFPFKPPGLKINDFDDWYIPSFFELETLRKNAGLVGGFSGDDNDATYWSSSERNLQQAFCLNFVSVKEIYAFKKTVARVRPIRKF